MKYYNKDTKALENLARNNIPIVASDQGKGIIQPDSYDEKRQIYFYKIDELQIIS